MGVSGSQHRRRWLVLLVLLAATVACAAAEEDVGVQYVEARMPAYEVHQEDSYLCTAVPLPDAPLKVVGIEPLAKQEIAHHMLLFGCEAPASTESVWECHMRSPCGSGPENTISHGEQVMYGWGRDAPGMHLPPGAGFSVGPRTGIRMAVLQVHYQIIRPKGDATGVRLKLTSVPQQMGAGMMTYAVGFVVPPRKKSHLVPNECCYSGFQPLTGFAFRVHAHALGRSIYMDRSAYGLGGEQQRLVAQDPQEPQGFYPVTEGLRFLPGDSLKVTCDFDSSERENATPAGSGSKNEMCNMYMMVTSEVPYFMSCGNSYADTHLAGPGGVPEGAQLLPELPARWQPPPPLGQAPPDAPPALGQVSGVDAGVETDTLWVLQRGARVWGPDTFTAASGGEKISDESKIPTATVLQLAKDTGAVLKSWGADTLVMPHSIAVDPKDGAVWVTDVGLHQALKFDKHGTQLLALGQPLQPGHDTEHLCKPTAVAFSRVGDVFVADGYCNSRVMQYGADGTFVREHKLTQGQLAVPHGLVVDDCHSALYVADREASAVHRFRFSNERPPPQPAAADDSTRHRRVLRQHSRHVHRASAAGAASTAARSSGQTGAGIGPLRQRPHRQPLQGGATEAAEMDPADAEADAGTADAGTADAGTADAGPADESTTSLDGEVDADMPQEAGPEDDAGDGVQMPTEDWQPNAGDEDSGPDFTLDLQEWGYVYGLTAGPYGSVLALCWKREANAVWLLLLDFAQGGGVVRSWPLAGVESPHDLTLTAAPLAVTGPGERTLAAYVAETREAGSSLRKFILLPQGLTLEEPAGSATGQAAADAATEEQPSEQQLAVDHSDAAAAAAAAAATQQQSAAEQAQAEELLHKEAATAAAAMEQAGAAAEQQAAATALPHDQELVAMSQDPSMEAYEVAEEGALRGAATKLLLMGLPFAGVFAAVAGVLWWRMSTAAPYLPVPTRDNRR